MKADVTPKRLTVFTFLATALKIRKLWSTTESFLEKLEDPSEKVVKLSGNRQQGFTTALLLWGIWRAWKEPYSHILYQGRGYSDTRSIFLKACHLLSDWNLGFHKVNLTITLPNRSSITFSSDLNLLRGRPIDYFLIDNDVKDIESITSIIPSSVKKIAIVCYNSIH